MVPGVPPGAAMPPQFNGYYPPPHQMPPQQPAPNGAPPMMGYPTPPQGENGQMFASSAPPPPTPPLHEPTQPPTHFTSPPQTRYVIFNICNRWFLEIILRYFSVSLKTLVWTAERHLFRYQDSTHYHRCEIAFLRLNIVNPWKNKIGSLNSLTLKAICNFCVDKSGFMNVLNFLIFSRIKWKMNRPM